jgi:hypothetical protein
MTDKRILHLTLYRQFFDNIVAGIKHEEYREFTPYWRKRLQNRQFDEIHFRNGYSKDRPFMRVECLGIIRDGSMFKIKLGKILETRNYDPELLEGRN